MDTTSSNTPKTSNIDPFDFLGSVKAEPTASIQLDSAYPSNNTMNNQNNHDILNFNFSLPPIQVSSIQNNSLNQGISNNQMRTQPIPPAFNFNIPTNSQTSMVSLSQSQGLPKGISLNLNPEVHIL